METERRRIFTSLAMLLGFTALGLLASCGGEDSIGDNGFDRSTLLTSLADDLIIPNFETLQSSVDALVTAVSTFNETPGEANLTTLRNEWVVAVEDFQHCSAFGFGPGSLALGPFATVVGVFPVDESQVEANLLDPEFNLAASKNLKFEHSKTTGNNTSISCPHNSHSIRGHDAKPLDS